MSDSETERLCKNAEDHARPLACDPGTTWRPRAQELLLALAAHARSLAGRVEEAERRLEEFREVATERRKIIEAVWPIDGHVASPPIGELVYGIHSLRDAEASARTALAASEARVREAERRLTEYQAAHVLIAHEYAFPWMREEQRRRMQETGKFPSLLFCESDVTAVSLLCSDTFGYACADAEDVPFAECPALVDLMIKEGWPGLMRWIKDRRAKAGAPEEFVRPVAESIAKYDDARDAAAKRADAAEAALAASEARVRELEQRVDAAESAAVDMLAEDCIVMPEPERRTVGRVVPTARYEALLAAEAALTTATERATRAERERDEARQTIANARYLVEQDMADDTAMRATLEGNGLEPGVAAEYASDLDRLRASLAAAESRLAELEAAAVERRDADAALKAAVLTALDGRDLTQALDDVAALKVRARAAAIALERLLPEAGR